MMIIGLLAAIWVIVDVVKSKKSSMLKLIWIIFAIFLSILTAIVYYFMEKR